MITLTPVAAAKVKDLLANRGNPQAGLRVGVRGGGCSGNSYFMEFCDAESPDDQVIESNGVRLVVDSRSVSMTVASGNRKGRFVSPTFFRFALAFIGSALVQNVGPPASPSEHPVCWFRLRPKVRARQQWHRRT